MPAAGRPSPLPIVLAWLLAVAAAGGLVLASGYQTGDPDSRVYVTVSARLATEPADRWIAPEWWGAWGRQGLFREHPIGIFVLPALLEKVGLPAAQAPYLVYLATQAACCVLLGALAARSASGPASRAVVWSVLLIPIAFVFRVRANQEYALLLGLLLAVYGVERARDRSWWLAVAVAGFLGALLVKGVFALLAPAYAALWLALRGSWSRAAWLGVIAMALLAPIVAVAYEQAYIRVAGESFLDYYLGARLGLAGESAFTPTWLLEKAGNVFWYVGRLLWYSAPWGFVLAWGWVRWRDAGGGQPQWVRFAIAAALLTVVALALRDTKADRYIFPAYFLVSGGGIALALDRVPRLARIMARTDRAWPWGPPLAWFVLVAGRVLLG